jgi:hypothetical protein
MKKLISKISIGLIFLLLSTVYCYSYFDLLIQKTDSSIFIGTWNYTNIAMQYLNNKNPTTLNDRGDNTNILKIVAKLLWTDIYYNESGQIKNGTLRPEFENFDNYNLIITIDNICDYISSFLKINGQNEIYYPDNNQSESKVINLKKILQPNQYEDYLNVFLSANLTYGYWTPITYTLTLEAEGDISDYALEILYVSPENKPQMFAYQYRIIDNNLNNPTISYRQIDKRLNSLLPIISNYQYDVSFIKYIGKKNYIYDSVIHNSEKPSFGNFNRFVIGANIGIGKIIQNKHEIKEQSLTQLTPETRSGMILIGKPNGNKVEIRLSITDRGSWNKSSFDIMPMIIRISRGTLKSGNFVAEVMPKITLKVVSGDVWY